MKTARNDIRVCNLFSFISVLISLGRFERSNTLDAMKNMNTGIKMEKMVNNSFPVMNIYAEELSAIVSVE